MNNIETSSKNLIKLEQYTLISVTGDDALDFLHNQFTNDLKKLANNTSSLSTWCSVKGRVLYSFRIWRTSDGFIIQLPSTQTDTFIKKLQMFVFRSKVTIQVLVDPQLFGLFGNGVEEYLSLTSSLTDNQLSVEDNLTVIKIPASTPRYLLITSDESDIKSLGIEQTNNMDEWQALDIEAGLVDIQPETADLFLPQMLNLEALGGLSFQKGCYPGQEIVARVKYRGELKKQLYRAEITTSTGVTTASHIVTTDNNQSKLVGHIVNVISSKTADTFIALVVINISDANEKNLTLKDQPNSSCHIQAI